MKQNLPDKLLKPLNAYFEKRDDYAHRPLHIVCAYAKDVDKAIVITVYQPAPERWVDFERRRI